ncbi:hypothetical protein AC244_17705 [Ensifer adhaerens]|uniref:Uncharacterized protein n=2 Tax=Ensifer adhaerens TaxID=106592 RepID=A0A0L8BS75_ENSAD|nr:hypothetical protein AC244_17705 [Ensifer adhaerens]
MSVVMYAVSAELAASKIASIVERPVLEDVVDGEKRRTTLGPPSILEAYLIENGAEDEKSVVREDLSLLAKEAGAAYDVLIIPDIMAENRQLPSNDA